MSLIDDLEGKEPAEAGRPVDRAEKIDAAAQMERRNREKRLLAVEAAAL
jgi:hypothetical protein